MTQEELKSYTLSKITLNKKFWEPKIETLFKENPIVTRESISGFFNEWLEFQRKENNAFLEEYTKTRNITPEEFIYEVETKIYANALRKNGLIPLEDVTLARDEVEMALDQIGFKV